jgi:UrcA family protein
MKINLRGLTVAGAGFALMGGIAVAQTLQEITVQATRILSTKAVGRDETTGSPILDISVSYGIKFDDLDLASHYGPIQLEKRVHDAAMDACKEITRQYPDSTPSDVICAKAAADKAMIKVHALVAAAGKAAAK